MRTLQTFFRLKKLLQMARTWHNIYQKCKQRPTERINLTPMTSRNPCIQSISHDKQLYGNASVERSKHCRGMQYRHV